MGWYFPIGDIFALERRREKAEIKQREQYLTDFFIAGQMIVFGSWINGRSSGYSEGDLITNPAYVIESILRDYLGYDDNTIDYASFDEAGNTTDGILKDWEFAGFVDKSIDYNTLLNNLLKQCKSSLFKNYEGKWQLSVYQSSAAATVDYKFDKDNNIGNIEIKRTSYNNIIGTIRVNYAKSAGSGKFQKQAFIAVTNEWSGAQLTSDVGTTDITWAVDDTTNISSGDYLAVDDEIVWVASVDSSTQITVGRGRYSSTPASHSSGTRLYIISVSSYNYSDGGSSSLEDTAVQAMYKYHTLREMSIDADFIQDDTTAEALRDHLFNYYSRPHYVVEFDTFLNAADLKIADIIEFDDSVMDAWLKLGGESWSGKKFEVLDISRTGLMDFHVKAVEL